VFVGDVAQAISRAIGGQARGGTIYELGGPEVKSFKQLMEYVLATIERKRLLIPLPFAIAKLQAQFLQYAPKPMITPDQVELLKVDNVVSEAAAREGRTLKGLGIDATAMETVVPSYLWRFRKTGQFKVRGVA
jgi:NADH dehydrogenase